MNSIISGALMCLLAGCASNTQYESKHCLGIWFDVSLDNKSEAKVKVKKETGNE